MNINWSKLGWFCVQTAMLILAGVFIMKDDNTCAFILSTCAGIIDSQRTGGFLER